MKVGQYWENKNFVVRIKHFFYDVGLKKDWVSCKIVENKKESTNMTENLIFTKSNLYMERNAFFKSFKLIKNYVPNNRNSGDTSKS